jgi:hypothetical protein
MSFICIITLTVELLDGGQDESAQYVAHQCWQSSVTAALPPHWQAERSMDNVRDISFQAKFTFWEPRTELHPVPRCLAFITGQFFFADGGLVSSLHVRSDSLTVYGVPCLCNIIS